MYCRICLTEYRDEITRCSDCDSELVPGKPGAGTTSMFRNIRRWSDASVPSAGMEPTSRSPTDSSSDDEEMDYVIAWRDYRVRRNTLLVSALLSGTALAVVFYLIQV